MDFMKAFMDQNMIAMIGEIVLFANTVTMAYSFTMVMNDWERNGS